MIPLSSPAAIKKIPAISPLASHRLIPFETRSPILAPKNRFKMPTACWSSPRKRLELKAEKDYY